MPQGGDEVAPEIQSVGIDQRHRRASRRHKHHQPRPVPSQDANGGINKNDAQSNHEAAMKIAPQQHDRRQDGRRPARSPPQFLQATQRRREQKEGEHVRTRDRDVASQNASRRRNRQQQKHIGLAARAPPRHIPQRQQSQRQDHSEHDERRGAEPSEQRVKDRPRAPFVVNVHGQRWSEGIDIVPGQMAGIPE